MKSGIEFVRFHSDVLHRFVQGIMMKRLELEGCLKKAGWKSVRHGGCHDVWGKGEREVILPRHNELNEYTALAFLEDAGLGSQSRKG